MNASDQIRNILNELDAIERGDIVLNEGMLQKLAGLALSAALALGPQISKADTVYSYLPAEGGQMQTVMNQQDIPTNAKAAFSIDTDTQQVTVVKGGQVGQDVSPEKPSSVPTNFEKVEPHHETNKDLSFLKTKIVKGLGIRDLSATGDNIFAPGLTVEQLLPMVKAIHDKRPPSFGEPISKFKIVPSDHNKSESMGIIEYENGKMELHLAAGGKLKSALVWQANNIPIGKEKKYIPIFLRWEVKGAEAPTEFDIKQ